MDVTRSMELLVLAVSNGSLSAAGRQLRMSPAAVTRHINALEDRLGVRLLNRSSRSLTLTEAGSEYYEHARRILHQMASAESRTRELAKSPSGTIRAHSRLFLGSRFITPAVPEFLEKHPDINLSLLMSNSDLNLHDHNLDVDIRLGRPADSGYALRKLGETQRIVVASQEYLACSAPLEKPADLGNHNCLIYTQSSQSSVWSFFGSDGNRTDVPVEGRFNSDFGPALRDLAITGLGVALMPEWSVYQEVENGQLIHCLPGYLAGHSGFGFDTGIYAIFVKDRHIAVKTRLFVDFLIEVFKRSNGFVV